jgi:putative ABC transport system ATP-binding protein
MAAIQSTPPEDAAAAAVVARNLTFAWPGNPPVLDIAEFRLNRGERVFLWGPSGSGKSTLLSLIGGVLKAGSGELDVLGAPLHVLSATQRDRRRAMGIGFIFQLFNLLPYLSVIDNVVLPCRFSGERQRNAVSQSGSVAAEAQRLLDHLGLNDTLLRRPVTQLSVGQQQRVAAARALIGSPQLLIADEPTSSLDHDARGRFLELLLAECQTAGTAVLFVSHDTSLGEFFDRRVALPELNRVGTEVQA